MPAISKIEAKFINAALCRDEVREHLSHPHVSEVGGVLWVVSTDGHRMHGVRAPNGCKVGYVALSKDGSIHAIEVASKFVPAQAVWCPEYDKSSLNVDVERLQALSSRHEKMHAAFGHGDECSIPRALYYGDPVGADQTVIWGGYLGDALLAVPGGKHAPGFVRVARKGAHDPVIIFENHPQPSWRAVVMPVRAHAAGGF